MSAPIEARLGFAKPANVFADPKINGLLRSKSIGSYTEVDETLEFHKCTLTDCNDPCEKLDFYTMGFDVVDLSNNKALQATLKEVKQTGVLSQINEKCIRKNLLGRSFHLSNGKFLRVLFISSEGMIIRKSGPNGLALDFNNDLDKRNKQPAASMVHGDQNVFGNPVRSLLKGLAPWIFRHNSPGGKNQISPLGIVNFWIPLQQITMPLCLMDRSTLDNKREQIRFAVPVDSILEREGQNQTNDIWTFLYNESQKWYFKSSMDANQAYVFDTLGMAHGAGVLPGEDIAEKYYLRLISGCKAIKEGNKNMLEHALNQPALSFPEIMTIPLREKLTDIENLFVDGLKNLEEIVSGKDKTWLKNAQDSIDSLTRKSIELRAMAFIW